MQWTVGARLRSAVGDTQVMVIRAPAKPVAITCGGHPLLPMDVQPAPGLQIAAGRAGATVLGKRYADADSGLELLCTKAGVAALFLDDSPLPVKATKPLPASD
ncbi:hypothetical protein [Mycobacterium sp. URHB0044]|uniref:hypothetical protein n=1 Tax=Mycobacterium sp. URHB0044 TaxID=1380386 RepID=UPI00048A5A5A|nr:hypothetical protein [Mycobacterium sp. URHB0044]